MADEVGLLQAQLSRDILLPAIDDQFFYTITGYRTLDAGADARAKHLSVPEVAYYRSLADLHNDATQGAQLLLNAFSLADAPLLEPLHDRFNTTVGSIERHLASLPELEMRAGVVAASFARLRDLGLGEQGGFAVRSGELALVRDQQALLAANGELIQSLVDEVEGLVAGARTSATNATEAAAREHVGARWPDWKEAMSADSIRPPFSFILAERIQQDHGVVGKVMPTTACTNGAPPGIAERRLLAEQFEIDTVISLHDPKAYAWSVKGHRESLLLMRRREHDRRSKTVRFVSLRRRPVNAGEAINVYGRLRNGDLADLGRVCEWPRERVEDGDWSPAVFYEPELAEACYELDQWAVTKPSRVVPLGDLYEVNTTKQTVGQSKWTWCNESEAEVSVAKSASESGQTRLQGRIDGWAKRAPAHSDNERELDLLAGKAGRLLVANTQDASSGRLAAVAFPIAVIGYAWTPVQEVAAADAQALSVWLNSTFGRIVLRKYGSRRANWPMYQPAATKQLVVPSTAGKHWPRMRGPLLDAYRATKDMVVPQYREPNANVRQVWDRAVAKAAGMALRKADRWRMLLAAEPFVCAGKATESD